MADRGLVVVNVRDVYRDVIDGLNRERLRLEAEAGRTTDKRKRARLQRAARKYADAVAEGLADLAGKERPPNG